MIVRVRLFARARDLAGQETLDVELANTATVAGLRSAIVTKCPALRELLPRCAVAVNEEFAGDDLKLEENADIAIIPPVSGGTCQAASG